MIDDYREGRLPRPDLTNLSTYFEAGIGFDHEAREMLAVADYEGLYKEKLAALHLARPMHADHRLWTETDIAGVEGGHCTEASSAGDMQMPAKQRKAGTR